jgi:4-amino-4-deoxy-L-arabinose transferase-like glycosyltransferase
VDIPPPGPRHLRLLAGFALAKLAIHLLVLTRYGWFRDELYYVVCARHPAWGYVDHPPLSIAVLALVRAVCGESLFAMRIASALTGAVVVALTGHLARQLGGGRFAQGLACLSALIAPFFLGASRTYSMNVLDLLLWTVAALVLVRILRHGRPRDWLVLGVVVGLGLLNKISMLWFGMGLVAGLILTSQRRVLLTPWPYVAAIVAGVIFLPHLLWQVANDWPTLEFMRNATGEKMAPVAVPDFVIRQVKGMGRGNTLVWAVGLAFALFTRAGRPWRVMAWLYLTVAVLLALGGRSRAGYLGVAYPMLVALGGVALERALAVPPWRRMRAVAVAVIVALTVPWMPFTLPILPVGMLVRYQAAFGVRPSTEERKEVGPLAQQYADMFGWEELVAGVADAWARLSDEERRRARVFGQNYGEAGAVDVLGRPLGLPRAASGHNNYWLWGPGDWDGRVLIIVGGDLEDHRESFETVEQVGTVGSPYAMPYERDLGIFIARGLRAPVSQVWPQVKHYD